MKIEAIRDNILSLTRLDYGWNYGEGEKIRDDAVLIALAISEVLPTFIYKDIEAYPLNDGSISLRVIFQRNFTIGLLINSETNISMYIDNGNKIENAGIIQLHNIKKFLFDKYILLKEKAVQCTSEDFYTKTIYQEQMAPMSQSAFYLEKVKKVSPSSILNVQVHVTEQCASTYLEEKENFPVFRYHTHIGYSQNTYYTRNVA